MGLLAFARTTLSIGRALWPIFASFVLPASVELARFGRFPAPAR